MTARTVNVAADGRRRHRVRVDWGPELLRAARFGGRFALGAPLGPTTLRASRFERSGPLTPVVVFLHEGLGSLSMWKDFPAQLCGALGMRGLVYSRPGYGKSTPRASGERWAVDFMQRQASDVLPALLAALDVPPRPWLFGHSDGASIALLFAATFPDAPAGVVALAPHLFVEDLCVTSIEAARSAYRSPACARGSRAIMTTRIPRSSAGTTSGSIPLFARGTSSARCNASVAPCSRSRARTTNMERWRRWTGSRKT